MESPIENFIPVRKGSDRYDVPTDPEEEMTTPSQGLTCITFSPRKKRPQFAQKPTFSTQSKSTQNQYIATIHHLSVKDTAKLPQALQSVIGYIWTFDKKKCVSIRVQVEEELIQQGEMVRLLQSHGFESRFKK